MIVCVEGPDGVGKSVLVKEIVEQTKGHYLHCTYSKNLDIEKYHNEIIECAYMLSQYQTVVLDRFAPSEFVYGKVFRGGESYNTKKLIDQWKDKITWIYCWNENAASNHALNKIRRGELYEDIIPVVEEYSKYVVDNKHLNWYTYNFNRDDKIKFVEEIIK